MNLNKVILVGRVTKDPEIRTTPSGKSVASFGLATNEYWKDNQGNRKEMTEFHNIIFWGKQADTIKEYVSKGMLLLIEGKIRTRSWESNGVKKYATDIVGEGFQFGPKPQNSSKNQDKEIITTYDEEKDEIKDEEVDKLEKLPWEDNK
jgi:single-strand DNA-binding protein